MPHPLANEPRLCNPCDIKNLNGGSGIGPSTFRRDRRGQSETEASPARRRDMDTLRSQAIGRRNVFVFARRVRHAGSIARGGQAAPVLFLAFTRFTARCG